MSRTLRGRDYLSLADFSGEEIREILALAVTFKRDQRSGHDHGLLRGKSLAMIFEKPSLRTRVTFELGMRQLGGHAVVLGSAEIQLGVRESVADVAANLERWVDGIMARTFEHATVEALAAGARVPVINGLSGLEHPCQALADLLTVQEKIGDFAGSAAAWVGDGNNVCHSFLLGAAKLGLSVHVATPEGYAPDPTVVAAARTAGEQTGAVVRLTHGPYEAVAGAKVIYTDVWTSMGQEAEKAARARAFAPFQVDGKLVAAADPEVVVLHCLPAHRGEEITSDVLDGPHSAVLDQAENRLHAQKALLALLL